MFEVADRLLAMLITSKFPNEAAGGTSTVIEKSEEEMIFPCTWPNHT
jgi:hypothetical protein